MVFGWGSSAKSDTKKDEKDVEKPVEKPPEKDTGAGKFDASALERGAKAMKQFETSTNAAKAYELTRLAEETKQWEQLLENERQQTMRSATQLQCTQEDAEEKRKMISQQNEQERRTAEYKARMDSELYHKKLEDQQRQIEQQLSLQHDQFLRQEELRKKNQTDLEGAKRRTLEEQAKHDRDTAVARAKEEAQGRADEERENVEVRLREMRARMAEERRTRMEAIQAVFSGLGQGSKALLEDRSKMTLLVSGLTALALGVYGARAGARVAGNLLEKRLMRPPLVRETSRLTWNRDTMLANLRWPPWKRREPKFFEKIVLQEELSERLQWTTNSLVNAKRNGTPFRHLLVHGPPGTGKTLFARTLARESGLDYAIMAGGDVGPLGKQAVHELNKLFQWANSSRKGLILFIDEADAFLRTGRGSDSGRMSEEARNVLSGFLHHTGTESDKFVVVLATNIREILDKAVLDRMDESFQFPLPSSDERRRMLDMFVAEHITRPTRRGRTIEVDEALDSAFLDDVAQRTEGFSGRQLAKLVLAYQAAVFGSGTTRLTKGLAETVLRYKLAHRDEDTTPSGQAGYA